MNHDDVVERLPWLLNGTLEDGEAQEVEEHLASCSDCRAERRRTAQAGALFAAHPGAEGLVEIAFAGREPDAALAAHLELCPDCREAVALARASAALQAEADPPVTAAARARRVPALATAGLAAALAVAAFAWALALARGSDRLRGELRASERAREGVAAELAEGRSRTAAAERRADEAGRRLVEALAGRANPGVVELTPAGDVQRSVVARASIEARPGDVLLLLDAGAGAEVALRARLRREDGTAVATIDGLRRDRHGAHALQLPREGLAPGALEVVLESATRPVARYRLFVLPASGPPSSP